MFMEKATPGGACPQTPVGRLDHPQGQPPHPKASSYAPVIHNKTMRLRDEYARNSEMHLTSMLYGM